MAVCHRPGQLVLFCVNTFACTLQLNQDVWDQGVWLRLTIQAVLCFHKKVVDCP